MAPTHPGTSREIHEARWPRTCSRPCAFEEIKTKKKTEKNPPHPKHTTKSTAARPPRPTRDGARRKTSHAVAHTSYASSIDPGFVEISLACIHTYPHCCCCAACIRFGALFSRQRSFCFLHCDIYLRFRGCAVVLDIELSVRAWCQKTRHALYCCARGVFCCCCFLEQTAESGSVRCAVCGISFKITYIMERKQKKDFSPIRTRKNPAASNICLLYTSDAADE